MEKAEPVVDRIVIRTSLLVGLCFGLQLMYAAFVLFGEKAARGEILLSLTGYGGQLYAPERDLPIYGVGVLFTLLMFCALRSLLSARLQPYREIGSLLKARQFAALLLGFFLIGTLLESVIFTTLLLRPDVALPAALSFGLILLPMVLELVMGLALLRMPEDSGMPRFRLLEVWLSATQPRKESPEGEPLVGSRWLDLVTPLLLLGLILIPDVARVAGADYLQQTFHHWDYFAIGPALAYRHGRALFTETYVQYGAGWPMLLSWLSPRFALGYGHAMQIAIGYGCLYFLAVYAFLRTLLRDRRWALGGVLLAIAMMVFGHHESGSIIWDFPSATPLRSPCDIWLLFALLQHSRTQRPLWLLLAGALVGLGLVFETDTGIYLALTLLAYAGAQGLPRRALQERVTRHWCIASGLLATGVLITGLAIGTRGTLLQPGFIGQWLEVFHNYPSGMSMQPVKSSLIGMLLSAVFLALYLWRVGAFLLRGRAALAPEEALLFCIAVLGLASLVYYIGRSHPINILHVALPFVILTTGVLQQATRRRSRAAAWILVASACLAMFANPRFREYPGLLQTALEPGRAGGEGGDCIQSDVCLPASHAQEVRQFREMAAEVQRLSSGGKRVAILANDETCLYLAADVAPWSRYTPFLPNMILVSQEEEMGKELADGKADVVLLPAQDPTTHSFHPVKMLLSTITAWQDLRDVVNAHYRFDHNVGPFEAWYR